MGADYYLYTYYKFKVVSEQKDTDSTQEYQSDEYCSESESESESETCAKVESQFQCYSYDPCEEYECPRCSEQIMKHADISAKDFRVEMVQCGECEFDVSDITVRGYGKAPKQTICIVYEDAAWKNTLDYTIDWLSPIVDFIESIDNEKYYIESISKITYARRR